MTNHVVTTTRALPVIGISVAIALSAAHTATSEMMMPNRKRELSDAARSLAHLNRINVHVPMLPRQLVEAGFDAKQIEDDWSKVIRKSGVEVTDRDARDTNLPTLRLQAQLGDVEEEGVRLALCIQTITVIQPAFFRKINRSLSVPTYVSAKVTMAHEGALREPVQENLTVLISEFARNLREARASAPTKPRRRHPDNVRSLAGIRKINVHVVDLPRLPGKAAISAETIRGEWVAKLRDADLKITDADDADPTLPTLHVDIRVTTIETPPDRYLFTIGLKLIQPAQLKGHDLDIDVVSFSDMTATIASADNVIEFLRTNLEMLIDNLVKNIRRARSRKAPTE